MVSSITPLRAFLSVSRYEFIAGGLFFLLVVSALALGTWNALWNNIHLVLWGSVMWYLSHMIGSQVNCLADYHLDQMYKKHLSAAVDRLGRVSIWICILAESILALAVTLYMANLTGKWILPVLWSVGYVVTMFYSLEPLRFKRRGILNPLSLILVLYILPVSYGYIALRNEIDIVLVSLFSAVGLQMFALILMNEVEDIPEDKAQCVETPCVKYGYGYVSLAALVLFSIGGVVSLTAFAMLEDSWSARSVVLILVGIGQSVIVRDLFSLYVMSAHRPDLGCDGVFDQVRHIGRRNSFHFAVLGLTLGIGSVLSLG